MTLNEYISTLLRRGWDETWLPELTVEQIAMIASLSRAELTRRIQGERHER